MEVSTSELTRYFRLEAEELIATLRQGLLELESAEDPGEIINELNRAAHSLKGAARLVDRFDLGDLAHGIEDQLAKLVGRVDRPARGDIDGLLEQTEQIESLLDPSEGVGMEEARGSSAQQTPVPDGGPTESLPSRPEARGESRAKEEFARVATETLDEIGRCAGEVVELGTRSETWLWRLHQVRHSLRALERKVERESPVGSRSDAAGEGHAKRGALAEARTLRSLVGSIVEEASWTIGALRPLGRRLHALSLEARMVAADEVSYRFEKTVRDAAAEVGKSARLELSGGRISVDRHVLQKLTEPISHLLRNAVVHGIETPEERAALGKPREGRILLSFERARDVIRVVIEDDGAGLDLDSIRRAAGLHADDRGTEQADVTHLIFRPGFSTSRETTKLAGRGVGLDVVQRAVHELRGEVAVQTESGRFCRFDLRVPSNVDVMEVFVLTTAGQDLLVPMRNMVRAALVKREEFVEHGGALTILVDGRPIRVCSLARTLSLREDPLEDGRIEVAVVRGGARTAAFVVDAIRGRQRVVVKRLASDLLELPALQAAAIMGDGRPGFLLDVNALIQLADGEHLGLPESADDSTAQARAVLVVDDSLTSRMLEKSLLESAGYRTHMASDGAEALEALSRSRFDLVVVDFEMPVLDGLEFATRVREQPQFADLPMVMLTSRNAEEDKRRGLAAGMNAYLIKGQFDQTTFLETIRDLIGEGRAR